MAWQYVRDVTRLIRCQPFYLWVTERVIICLTNCNCLIRNWNHTQNRKFVCGKQSRLQVNFVQSNGVLLINVINGWYFRYKIMASEYLLTENRRRTICRDSEVVLRISLPAGRALVYADNITKFAFQRTMFCNVKRPNSLDLFLF